ncbi:putative ArsR family transcriptional regulator [Pullulanibacillus pueri]|uniref:DeoR family transcriptional regulator n=1 Tax=Pullulanibacillus pueri TaxID=1437324 RepID=A0A8J3EIU9_9BACL|nr:metalloregulator ArsR/SmtB family transcription factor [Pullulanibacillus pueri]MBM7679914.1 putative ArsR family transcriptional regulator [Pullulanibacillus pueri]GGH73464.1 DeoR family transcriptional regulator [Pullulanibacillus pueri]
MASGTTKDKILELLKKEVTLTVNDLTNLLNITHMAVRKHLNMLERDGLIQSREVKQSMGRPLQTFSLSEKGERLFPKNYEGMSVEFLKDIKDLHGEDAIYYLFKKREARQTQSSLVRMEYKSNEEKINEMVNIQNEKGYMADVSQIDDTTYEITEYNCPILAVAKEFKVACHCETDMFKNVLETDKVKRTCCKTEGNAHCKFLIQF